jgi:tetratricopeptide (TPR) repeat protein
MTDDPEAVLERAFALDREGREREALAYYERARELGVPGDLKRRFYVGYGSTLRNVGRADDAVGVLGEALADDPNYPPFAAFLALALLSAGHSRAALAAMLGCALDVAVPGSFDSFERALGHYHQELLEPRE